ncbi:hypothetical protein [Clostridium fungisolvens]|uniref:Uncharacterized protein n=1 Tax=Clostridium fungisolvens TaxID=1604897 RepID=A0A6V8SEG7_9CLOT|nr:hypothetical protein [Clostridium fungisolvens]GFP74865.1 hypothetical protein bsdtw1_00927 [Clostridium fungisolvens]
MRGIIDFVNSEQGKKTKDLSYLVMFFILIILPAINFISKYISNAYFYIFLIIVFHFVVVGYLIYVIKAFLKYKRISNN